MKRMIKQIASLVLLLSVFCSASFSNIVYSYDSLLSGIKNSGEILEGMQFRDVTEQGNGYWAREAIYTMAALGIVKGYDGGIFLPSSFVTRSESLALIYRAMSLEPQAQAYANVIAEKRRDNPGTVSNVDIWADGYIQLAYNNGLITEKQYQDSMRFNQEIADFRKTDNATREEIVFWIAKVLHIPPVSYSNYPALSSFADANLVDKEIAPYFEAVLNAQLVKGSNGYLYPDRPIKREEMAQILLNCKKYILDGMSIKENIGTINSLPNLNSIIITSHEGLEEYIVTEHNQGLVVIGNDRVGGASLLREQDRINYYVNNHGEVVLVSVRSEQNQQTSSTGSGLPNSYVTSGVVQSINIPSLRITLFDESGRTSSAYYRNFSIADRTNVKILKNNVETTLDDIYPQDKVFLKIENGLVSEISFSRTTTEFHGTLTNKTDNVFDIRKDNGETQRFSIKSTSAFFENNYRISLKDIIVGSKVKVSATKNSDEFIISRVDVQAEYLINNIYKAYIESYDSVGSKLVVKDLMKMEREFWGYTVNKGFVEFPVTVSSKMFYNNEKIQFDNINQYRGMEVFIATELGIDGSDKLAFARLSSSSDNQANVYNGEVSDIYTSTNRLNISKFHYNFNTGDGTIFVKDGKLVTLNEISKKDNAYIVATGSGSFYTTHVVYIDDRAVLEDYEIYFADITNVEVGQRVEIQTFRYYDKVKGDWIYSSRKRTLNLTSNTRIFDDNGVVNNRELTSISSTHYITANIVVSNGEAIVISLGENARYSMKARIGSITKTNDKIDSFYIYDARQYYNDIEEWLEEESGNIIVRPNTIYMKDGNVIFDSDVKEGDRVTIFYNGRDVRTAVIIYVD